MLELIINNFEKIIGGILTAVLGGYVSYRIYQKTRFHPAAAAFRSKLLALLEGYYPSIHSCGADDYAKIRATIPKVESITADFSHFLEGSTKSKFQIAVKEYCEYCKNIDRQHDAARAIYNHPSRPNQTDGSEVFNTENLARQVDNLLSFAKEK